MRAVFIGALLSSQLRSVVRMQLIASFGRLDKGPPPINIAKQTAQQVIVIARIAPWQTASAVSAPSRSFRSPPI
jgi:hypothetical protein